MSVASFKKYMKELGWRNRKLIGGGNLDLEFSDRILLVDPQVRERRDGEDGYSIDLNAGITTRRFLDYCNFILEPKEKGGFAFFQPRAPIRVLVSEINKDAAFDASAKVISWAKRLDLQQCLRSNLTYPNEAAPLFSVYRFIALKIDGRMVELEKILADVKTWNKAGFDPNITPERVERAIALDVSGGL